MVLIRMIAIVALMALPLVAKAQSIEEIDAAMDACFKHVKTSPPRPPILAEFSEGWESCEPVRQRYVREHLRIIESQQAASAAPPKPSATEQALIDKVRKPQ